VGQGTMKIVEATNEGSAWSESRFEEIHHYTDSEHVLSLEKLMETALTTLTDLHKVQDMPQM